MQKFNLCEKLMAVSICLLFGMMPIMDLACSSRNMATDPAPATQTQEPNVQPDRPPEVNRDSLAMMMEYSRVMEATIAKMDKYVTTNNDGTYSIDYQGFLRAEGKNLKANERQAAEDLNKGIPIVNEQILQERRSPGSTALGSACWIYWWGKRCCYWGTTAAQLANALQGGGVASIWFPYFGAVSAAVGTILQSCYLSWGGYCLNMGWGGLFWITRP